MSGRYDLSSWQFQLISEFFPPPNRTGRKRADPKRMLNAIFWILCSGASWRDLPDRYGPWQTAYHWFNTWSKDGTIDRVLESLQVKLNEGGLVDLDTWYVDSTHVRASRAAAGAKKGGLEALGRSRGGFSTKLHLVCDGSGNPLRALLTPGQQHESTVAEQLVGGVRVKALGRGRPRSRPKRLVADRAYDVTEFRRYLSGRGVRGVIPEKKLPEGKKRRRRGRPPVFCAETYKGRNIIERLVGWLKEHRRIATRYEKLAGSFLAMVQLAFIRRYFRALEPFSDRT